MQFQTPTGPVTLDIRHLVVAGWTGRDAAKVTHHIEELAAIGVAPPSTVPLFYRTSSNLLQQGERVEVVGPGTSGEVEPLVMNAGGQLWLGLGSDHTDRPLEAHSVAASKQACAKPVASQIWPLAEVKDHLDALELHCDIRENGAWVVYQTGTLASIRPLMDLVAGANLPEGGAMLCGTLGAIGGVREAAAYRMRLTDPVLGREITMHYETETLPVIA
ncbi:DUF2848 domain-containing protein [Albirhodobacter sp. R86504]|uniref:DUF2848 domain-containing protein n=1 Tax=Albirhodobacter sp. R86504 TaxID=3093848 RepID=UPI00366F39F8